MGRGVSQQALSNYGQAGNEAGLLANQAGNVYNTLFPQLESEATNPQGIGPTGLAAENTANQQSIGGSQAGAEEAGNLAAARTRNAGGFAPAIAESSRAGSRQLSQNAVGIQANNEQLKQQQRQAALAAMQGLFGTQLGSSLGFRNAATGSLNAATNANQQGSQDALAWAKFFTPGVTTSGPNGSVGFP